MYHSINFGNKNTYDDWKIVPETRPVVVPPEPIFIFDEIPGASGSLDLTTSLTGLVNYSDRTGSFTFLVLNDYGEWQDRYAEIMSYLHGKRMQMTLEDDPNYYYIGRYFVSEWSPGENWSSITIDYHLDPFKYSHAEKFIRIPLTGTSTVYRIHDIDQLTLPSITPSRNLQLVVNANGVTRSLQRDQTYNDIAFYPNSNGFVNLALSYNQYETEGHLDVTYRKVLL